MPSSVGVERGTCGQRITDKKDQSHWYKEAQSSILNSILEEISTKLMYCAPVFRDSHIAPLLVQLVRSDARESGHPDGAQTGQHRELAAAREVVAQSFIQVAL